MRTVTFVTTISCSLPEDGFGEWKEISEETKALFNEGPIPCEGDGPWPGICDECRFCIHYETDVDE